MARLKLPISPVILEAASLLPFGKKWKAQGGSLSRTPPYSSGELGEVFDTAYGKSLSQFLGAIPVCNQTSDDLIPPKPDCVELGSPRIVGGVRPQNFDVCYRPDGVRIAHDTKTLNDRKSIQKNWQNMINDLATEATTVHTRFPHAIVTFAVLVPKPALKPAQEAALIETLERMARRVSPNDDVHLAEAIALLVWDPDTGLVDDIVPPAGGLAGGAGIRIESFASTVEKIYWARYKGLPPHAN